MNIKDDSKCQFKLLYKYASLKISKYRGKSSHSRYVFHCILIYIRVS